MLLPLAGEAAPIRSITAETTRMPQQTLLRRFNLKEGEEFTQKEYDRAVYDLRKSRAFRDLDVLYKEHKDGIDIHIKADDRAYILPILPSFNTHKHAVGVSVAGGNLLKQGEQADWTLRASKDGWETYGHFTVGRHAFSTGYSRLNFHQYFYQNGWVSVPGIWSVAEDKGDYSSFVLGNVHTKQDLFYLRYQYQLSSLWSVFIVPTYENDTYSVPALDSGNHNHVSFGLQYTDDLGTGMSLHKITETTVLHKKDMLRDLPRVRRGKLAEATYTSGASWTGSDYTLQKASVGAAYAWEFKSRHRLELLAKAQRAFDAPFTNLVQSSDLLFGLGIYDREQRGKNGVSAGLSFTYFLVRNHTGLLSLMPFYEQAYVSPGGHSYQPHSGVGATLTYRLWRIPVPLSLNFTHNLNDGAQHIGFKLGGEF